MTLLSSHQDPCLAMLVPSRVASEMCRRSVTVTPFVTLSSRRAAMLEREDALDVAQGEQVMNMPLLLLPATENTPGTATLCLPGRRQQHYTDHLMTIGRAIGNALRVPSSGGISVRE